MRFAVALGLLACLWISFAVPSSAWSKEGTESGKATAKSSNGAAKKGKGTTSGKAEKASKGEKEGDEEAEEESGPANDSFTVIQIGAEDVRVIKSAQLSTLRSKLAGEYKAALKEYSDEKLAKAKAKQKFEGKKPVKKDLKVLATALKSEDAAKALKDKTVLAIEKKKKAKEKAK